MPVRVLIVDDSVLFRTKMQLSLGEDREISVVGCAANANEAMQLILDKNPDVVTLDIEMPQTNGIDFLKKILPQRAIPVVVVSALPINALDALDAGAVDFVRKPDIKAAYALTDFFADLREKIKVAAKAKVHCHPRVPASTLLSHFSTPLPHTACETVIAIGASTGGTEAIIEVVKDLPENTPGIVIVQHMPANFTRFYAQRLDKICKMSAKEAENLDRVQAGRILLAAGEYHLTLKKDSRGYYVESHRGPKVNGHCPSVDVLFHSVGETAGKNAIGVILTGMGADGAKGILDMHQKGCYTIGQDRDSCVVYGMPMEAYKLGAISRQLSLDQIGTEILYHLHRMKKDRS